MPSLLAVMDAFWKRPYSLVRDSTHLLLLECQRRGIEIYVTSPEDLSIALKAKAYPIHAVLKSPYLKTSKAVEKPLNEFDVILMRKDPPINARYLRACKILSRIPSKTRVINNPSLIEKYSEKSIILKFPRWIPATLITKGKNEAFSFLKKHQIIVLKPTNSYAGKGLKLIRTEKDLPQKFTQEVVLQEYLPEIETQGEKRIFMINGKAEGCLLKKPAKSTFIANPDLGATLSKTSLTLNETNLCSDVGKFLKKNGVFFAGLDLIGEKLTEINFTSPGLLWEWNELTQKHHEKMIVSKMLSL